MTSESPRYEYLTVARTVKGIQLILKNNDEIIVDSVIYVLWPATTAEIQSAILKKAQEDKNLNKLKFLKSVKAPRPAEIVFDATDKNKLLDTSVLGESPSITIELETLNVGSQLQAKQQKTQLLALAAKKLKVPIIVLSTFIILVVFVCALQPEQCYGLVANIMNGDADQTEQWRNVIMETVHNISATPQPPVYSPLPSYAEPVTCPLPSFVPKQLDVKGYNSMLQLAKSSAEFCNPKDVELVFQNATRAFERSFLEKAGAVSSFMAPVDEPEPSIADKLVEGAFEMFFYALARVG